MLKQTFFLNYKNIPLIRTLNSQEVLLIQVKRIALFFAIAQIFLVQLSKRLSGKTMSKIKNNSKNIIPQWQSDKMRSLIAERWQEVWQIVEKREQTRT